MRPQTEQTPNQLAKETDKPKHINFFEDLEKAASTHNEEYMAEKREQEKRELMKYTTFLGQSAAESKAVKPWYYDLSNQTRSEELQKKLEKRKDAQDPLLEMNKFISKTKKHREKQVKKSSKTQRCMSKFEKLRQERIERENAEKERIAKLLSYKIADDPRVNAAYPPRPSSNQYRSRRYEYSSGYRQTSYLDKRQQEQFDWKKYDPPSSLSRRSSFSRHGARG